MRRDLPPYRPHDPQVSNMREVFLETLEQLAKPFPSLLLNDWKHWNQLTGGFRKHEFSIFCGSTGSGKTTFLANVSAQLLKQGTRHFVMSVETGRHDWMRRVLSVLAGRDLNTGEAIDAEYLSKLTAKHLDLLSRDCIELSHYEDRTPVEQLKHDLRYMLDRGCGIAFIDNLNFFMEVTTAQNAVIEMDRVIHDLIIFVKQHPIHIVMVMHPKKGQGVASTRVESEFDVKGSSTAVQEAQNVFLWNRPRREDVDALKRKPTDRELILAKMRRRGLYVGSTLIFGSEDGTSYAEKGFG